MGATSLSPTLSCAKVYFVAV